MGRIPEGSWSSIAGDPVRSIYRDIARIFPGEDHDGGGRAVLFPPARYPAHSRSRLVPLASAASWGRWRPGLLHGDGASASGARHKPFRPSGAKLRRTGRLGDEWRLRVRMQSDVLQHGGPVLPFPVDSLEGHEVYCQLQRGTVRPLQWCEHSGGEESVAGEVWAGVPGAL